ncbi:MAG: hypothetical protein PHU85_02955 [Phycisphaerae bacterium]|nr:hypothetical protein [Phycisphaerae bacterium]
MLTRLLAETVISPGPDQNTLMLRDLYDAIVRQMPPGGIRLMLVLVGLALVVGLWIAWGQRTLANNQLKIAAMLEKHLAEHDEKK